MWKKYIISELLKKKDFFFVILSFFAYFFDCDGNVGLKNANKPLPGVRRSHTNHPSAENTEPVLNT